MINDLKKSFNEILYERTTSPLYGTLVISWMIWNWKIIYLTFFISEKSIKINKIDYILLNFSDVKQILIFPLISTLILLTIIPFISNGAFWLSLNFNKWKIDQKNLIDKKQLLSIEQSIELREEISKQEERFAKLVENKNLEISQLNLQLEEYKQNASSSHINLENLLGSVNNNSQNISEYPELSERVKANPIELKQYELTVVAIQLGHILTGRKDITPKFIALLESYEIIENKGNGHYRFTSQGRKFQKLMV